MQQPALPRFSAHDYGDSHGETFALIPRLLSGYYVSVLVPRLQLGNAEWARVAVFIAAGSRKQEGDLQAMRTDKVQGGRGGRGIYRNCEQAIYDYMLNITQRKQCDGTNVARKNVLKFATN